MDDSAAVLPDIAFPVVDTLNNIMITSEEVKTVLQTLKLGKSSGPDNINNRILKEIAIPISEPLSDLYNFSLSHGIFPEIWKQANVSPLYKKDDPSLACNYRPISLLSTVGKVMEKIVHKHIFIYFKLRSHRANGRVTDKNCFIRSCPFVSVLCPFLIQ